MAHGRNLLLRPSRLTVRRRRSARCAPRSSVTQLTAAVWRDRIRSPCRRRGATGLRSIYSDWLASLQSLDFDSMSQDGKVDYILFKNHLEYELRQLDIQGKQLAEIQPLIPFAKTIIDLEEARRRMEPINSAKVAATLNEMRKQVDERRRAVEGDPRDSRKL